jgi:serine protease Do
VIRRLFLVFVLVTAGFVAGLVVTGRMRSASDSGVDPASPPSAAAAAVPDAPTSAAASLPGSAASLPGPPPSPATSPQGLPSSLGGGPDFTRIAGRAVKGVANISSLQVEQRRSAPTDDPFFNYFFGNQDLFGGSRSRSSLSLGSGAIVSPDGYIVTNNHVVGENMREITVTLPDKRELPGKVIGTDPATDIALLKVEAKGLPNVAWGDSSALQVGEWVLAIGSPFRLSQTVTAGIVSATGRADLGFAEYEDFIQTDAAINPGNSGGALINSRGELVGINTGIFSQSGGYQGIGFAVPSNLAKHVADDLMKFGMVHRGTIGGIVQVEGLTPQIAQELAAPNTNGALISRMASDSEAYKVGIRPGDIITGFNGQSIQDQSQLFRMVADARIGSSASIKILRQGRSMEFKVPIVQDSRKR